MKTLITTIIAAIIIVLLILNLKNCKETPGTVIVETKIDTVRQFVYKDSIQYVSKTNTEYILTANLVEFIDTVYIISDVVNDHFAKIHYLDTVKNDSSAKIIISDTIFMNRLLNRKSFVETYNKTVYDNSTFKAFLGTFVNQNVNTSFGIDLTVEAKKNMFTVGIGTNKTYYIGYKRLILKR